MVTQTAPIPKKRLIIAASLAAFLLVSASIYYAYSSRSGASTKLSFAQSLKQFRNGTSNNPPTSTQGSQATQVTVSITPTDTTTPTLPPKKGLRGYVSKNNRLGFYFNPNPGDNNIDVKEVGNKVNIYDINNPNISQSLEVFQKDPNDSIEKAITKAVLSGYSSSDCQIKVQTIDSHYPNNYITATIQYNADNQIKNSWGVADTSKCPIQYTVNYDNKIFVVDKNHSDRLVFFNLGQYTLAAGQDSNGNTLSWHDTLTFF